MPGLSRTGLLFALIGLAGLVLPLVQFRPNRIVPGEGITLHNALPAPWGWVIVLTLGTVLIAACVEDWPGKLRLPAALAALLALMLVLGSAARHLTPPDDILARVSPASGFWLTGLAFALMLGDALNRLRLRLALRWAMLASVVILVLLILGSGVLDQVSVMREYAARDQLFVREAAAHLFLAFGSLGLALLIGLPLGLLAHQWAGLRRPVLGVLNILQTIPSLALFGIMIPIFGWIAANVPGAAQAGIAGIGVFPALMALFLYALLPVVSNTLAGLDAVSPATRDAAAGLGMTRMQILWQVLIPLAFPVLLAAIRIVLVQNIGLAVIAGLIGGGGFGTFVFQGLNQTAMDLVLLGTLPTIALALVAGIALDLTVEAASKTTEPRQS